MQRNNSNFGAALSLMVMRDRIFGARKGVTKQLVSLARRAMPGAWSRGFAPVLVASMTLFACTSRTPGGDTASKSSDGPVASTAEALVSNLEGCTTINNRTWCSRSIYGTQSASSVHASTTYDDVSHRFTVTSDQQGIYPAAGSAQTTTTLPVPNGNPVDGVRYVYTPITGDVDMVVHVWSTTSNPSPQTTEIGVMLRSQIPLPCLTVGGDCLYTGGPMDHSLPSAAPVQIAAWFGNTRVGMGSEIEEPVICGDGWSSVISQWVSASRATSSSEMSRDNNNTRLSPPGLYLRVTRVADDYAVARSRDGITWTPLSGGALPANTPGAAVGFFASANGHDWQFAPRTSQTAVFEVVSIADHGLSDRRSSWLGTEWVRASTTAINRDMQAFYVDNNGISYKVGSTADGGSSRISALDANGNSIPLSGAIGGFGIPRAIAADPSYLYVGVSQNVNTPPYWVERLHRCSGSGPCDLSSHCCAVSSSGACIQYPTFPTRPQDSINQFGLIGGIATAPATGQAIGTTVYVSDVTYRRIHVLSWPNSLALSDPMCSGAAEIATINVGLGSPTPVVPGPLAVDASGSHIWVIQPSVPAPPQMGVGEFVPQPGLTPRLLCFQSSGKGCISPYASADLSTLAVPITNPTAISVAPATGQLLITDNGIGQNVRVCTSTGVPCAAAVGRAYGVFALKGAYPAIGTTARFFSPLGAGQDSSGNTYVGQGAPLVGITKVDSSGNVVWTRHGVGAEPGSFDPGMGATVSASTPGRYYTTTRRMLFNFALPSGQEWLNDPAQDAVAAVTWNPFYSAASGRTAPVAQVYTTQQPWTTVRLPSQSGDVDARTGAIAGGIAAPLVREVLVNGATTAFEFLPYASSRLEMFRFDGEIAVPSGALDSLITSANTWQLSSWSDVNGDGLRPPPDCDQTVPSVPDCLTEVNHATIPTAFHPDVDKNADVWLSMSNTIWHLPKIIVTTGAAPILKYDVSSRLVSQVPADFSQVDFVRFDADRQTLYVLGWAPGTAVGGDECQIWNNQHPALGAYTISGSQLTKQWVVELPAPRAAGADDFFFHVMDVSCMDANGRCQTLDHDWGYNSLAIAGNYVFIEEQKGPVHVHRKSDGGEQTRLFAGAEVSGAFAIRSNQNMQAIALSSGEYVVTSVDTMAPPRTEVLRWTP